ncbi:MULTISPECIES: ImmA/IrrE family metallo-endopeptidase [Orbaceae]|jgi:hypothetical protein|nr:MULTISPECIES: ImmA/IrrE family metallo-endopeptidase [Orbaceae]OCG32933.1 toxin [Gilliamella apicola]
MTEEYQMRGNRVAPMEADDIVVRAINSCKVFQLSEKMELNFDTVFETFSLYRITLQVIDDREWLGITDGHCDPSSLTISIPNKTYKAASKGKREALFTIFHELGHLLLGHKAVLHHSQNKPTYKEDAEWQADLFATVILLEIGLERQLSFNFEM